MNIREQLRLEKKRVQKEINDVDEKVTRIEQDQTHFVQDIKREKLKESSKYSVELQRNQSAIRESENKVGQKDSNQLNIFKLNRPNLKWTVPGCVIVDASKTLK